MRPIPYDIAFEVFSHIDPRNTPTLLACSLAHPSWTLPAQRRLYHTVQIRNREGMRRWYEFDAKDKFIPYVRHLVYCGDEEDPLGPHDFLEMYGGQFLGFTKLRTMEIRHLALERFNPDSFRSVFGHLRKTLRALLISDATLTLSGTLGLLNLFPRLHCLGLDHFMIAPEPFQVPSEPPLFRGTLNLSGPVNERCLRFIEDLTWTLPNFSSVRLRLNLSHHATQQLLEIPGFANHVTTMLLGYQDGNANSLLSTGKRLTQKCLADVPEHPDQAMSVLAQLDGWLENGESMDLHRCRNLRVLSIRTHWCSERLVNSLVTLERSFRLGTTIPSELEFLVIETGPEPSFMQYSTWGRFFEAVSALQASCKRLPVVVDSYERFMAKAFQKGDILARFLGCGSRDR